MKNGYNFCIVHMKRNLFSKWLSWKNIQCSLTAKRKIVKCFEAEKLLYFINFTGLLRAICKMDKKTYSLLSYFSPVSPKMSSQGLTEDEEIIIVPKKVKKQQPDRKPFTTSPEISSLGSSKHVNASPSSSSNTSTYSSTTLRSSTMSCSMTSSTTSSTMMTPTVQQNSEVDAQDNVPQDGFREVETTSGLQSDRSCVHNTSPEGHSEKLPKVDSCSSSSSTINKGTASSMDQQSTLTSQYPSQLSLQDGVTKETAVDLSTINNKCKQDINPVCTISKIPLYEKDFRILKDGCWLNCKLMEAYMGLLIQWSKQNGVKVKLFTSHMLTKYNEKGFDSIRQWVTKDDIFLYDVIVAVDNTSKAHWTLLYMNFQLQTIMHLDPLSGRLSKSILSHFRELMGACHMAIHGKQFNWIGWIYHGANDKELPLQEGSDDCGIMTLSYAKFLLCDKLLFQMHKSGYRDIIMRELQLGKLLIAEQDLDNSGSDNREGLTDSSIDAETLPSYTTPAERYARGLSSKAISRKNVEVRLLHNGERGAFATRHFSRGDFVCEYASKVLLKEESRADEERYQEAGLGSYCLDAKYQGIWYTFDATLTLKDPGRYINHASSHCNLRLMAPIMIGRGANQRLRIGFLALQEIYRGEQLFFDYGYRDQDWMVCDARKFALTVSTGDNSIVPFRSAGQISKGGLDGTTVNRDCAPEDQPKQKKSTATRTRRDCPLEGCASRNLKSISDHLKSVHKVLDRQERLALCQKAKDIYLKKQEKHHQTKKVIQDLDQGSHRQLRVSKRRKAAILCSESESDEHEQFQVQNQCQKASPMKRRKLKEIPQPKHRKEEIPVPSEFSDSDYTPDFSEDNMSEESLETPIVDKYHYLQKTEVNFDIDGLITHLQTLDGTNKAYEAARAIGAHVRGYFHYVQPTRPPHAALLDFHSLTTYFTHLKTIRKFTATTISEKLRAIRHTIDYVMYEQSNEGSHSTLMKCQEVKERLKKWGNALTKDIRKQRNEHALKCSHEVTTADDPLSFLNSQKVLQRVEEAIEIAKGRPLIWNELKVVLAYLAAHIIYLNGQRPGVVQRMTTDEWMQRVTVENDDGDDEWVIHVLEHKTTGAFGPAKVAVSSDICSLMEEYFLHIRGKITPKHEMFEKRFFLTNTGNEFCKIGERMKDVAKVFGFALPTVGLQRKVVATEAFKTKDDITVRSVQKHMCHSATTCEKFYQHTDNKCAITTKKAIQKIMMARHFTQAESDAIVKEYPLTEAATPSLAICQIISEKYNLQKTKKQIQDHWRAKKNHN